MGTMVAFLRGMNLGRRRLTNDELAAAFHAIGFAGAAPYQASGNVIIDADADADPHAGTNHDDDHDGVHATDHDDDHDDDHGMERLRTEIETGLSAQLGYPVPTFLRTADEIDHIAAATPFTRDELAATTDRGKVQVVLLHAAPPPAVRDELLAFATDDDRLAVIGREVYWLPRDGLTESALDMTALGERLLGGVTVRTQATIQRIAARVAG